jgi:tetratricopeptide (TPR) repeat protein
MKMKRIFLLPLFICLPFLYVQAQIHTRLIDSASKYIDAKNYGKAINIYSSILASDSMSSRVYELRGSAYQEMQDYESAMLDFNFTIKRDPCYWLGYLRRADLYAYREYFEYAINDYNYAFALADSASQKVAILVNRAHAKRSLTDTIGAESDYRRALKYDSTDIVALSNLGTLLAETGKSREAIKCLENVIRLDSTFSGGFGNLAFLYSLLGDYKKCVEINNRLLAIQPNAPYALNNRGFAKFKLNDPEGALEDIVQ